MYLFTREAQLRGSEAASWATEIGARASKVSGGEVQVWTRAYSAGVGIVSWTSWWSDLGEMASSFAKLDDDHKYAKLVADGADFVVGGVDDALFQTLYEGSGATQEASIVGVVTAVCRNGQLATGVANGIAIAQKYESITGRSTLFVAAMTGTYGGVAWLTGYDDLSAYQEANTKSGDDPSWLSYVDTSTGCYGEDASLTRSTIFARLA